MRRESGDNWSIPWSFKTLGYSALREGDYDRAAATFREGLTFSWEHELRGRIEWQMMGLAAVAGAKGEVERAARLFGASEALRESIGISRFPCYQVDMDRDVAAARTQLDEETWQQSYDEGQAMSMEQAVDYALEDEASDYVRSNTM
jgi:non-specific serine/threonine protein kinase